MHVSPHLSNAMFLATCKLRVRHIFPSKETSNQGRYIPCPFQQTRQLANYLNYSSVNIISFPQPLFAVSKKRAKRPKLSQIIGFTQESLQGRSDGGAATVTRSTQSSVQDRSRMGSLHARSSVRLLWLGHLLHE